MKLAVVLLITLLACCVGSACGEESLLEESGNQDDLTAALESLDVFGGGETFRIRRGRQEKVAARLTNGYIKIILRIVKVDKPRAETFIEDVEMAVKALFTDGPPPTAFTA